jgi:hypothetical protein
LYLIKESRRIYFNIENIRAVKTGLPSLFQASPGQPRATLDQVEKLGWEIKPPTIEPDPIRAFAAA